MIKREVLEWKYIRSEKVNVSGITRFIHHASGLFRSNYARQTLPLDTLFFSHMDIEERKRGFWCSSKTCSTSRKKQCPHICPDRSPLTRASYYLWFTSLIATQQNRDQAKWNDKRSILLLQNLFPRRSRYIIRHTSRNISLSGLSTDDPQKPDCALLNFKWKLGKPDSAFKTNFTVFLRCPT